MRRVWAIVREPLSIVADGALAWLLALAAFLLMWFVAEAVHHG